MIIRLEELLMKRLKFAIIIILVLSLSGCVKEKSLTEEKSDAIAEYMAGLILKYDRNYNQEMFSTAELTSKNSGNTVTQAPTQVPTPTPTLAPSQFPSQGDTTAEVSDKDNSSVTDYSMLDVLKKKNFDINYKSYRLTNTYPDDTDKAYFVLEPRNGYQLMVVTFTTKNLSKSSKTLNLSKDNFSYKLKINETVYKPLLTLLENDLQYIDEKIGSGKTKKALLIFEISKDDKVTNGKLEVSKGKKTGSIVIN
jgi:hypothetical protein